MARSPRTALSTAQRNTAACRKMSVFVLETDGLNGRSRMEGETSHRSAAFLFNFAMALHRGKSPGDAYRLVESAMIEEKISQ